MLAPATRRPVLVLGGSETGDKRDASSLGIAEEPVLAGVAPIHRRASVLLTSVRAAEAEVMRRRHLRAASPRGRRRCCIERRPRPSVVGDLRCAREDGQRRRPAGGVDTDACRCEDRVGLLVDCDGARRARDRDADAGFGAVFGRLARCRCCRRRSRWSRLRCRIRRDARVGADHDVIGPPAGVDRRPGLVQPLASAPLQVLVSIIDTVPEVLPNTPLPT